MDEEKKRELKKLFEEDIALVPQRMEGEYEAIFEKFDQDKSGFLEKGEAKLLFKDLCND